MQPAKKPAGLPLHESEMKYLLLYRLGESEAIDTGTRRVSQITKIGAEVNPFCKVHKKYTLSRKLMPAVFGSLFSNRAVPITSQLWSAAPAPAPLARWQSAPHIRSVFCTPPRASVRPLQSSALRRHAEPPDWRHTG